MFFDLHLVVLERAFAGIFLLGDVVTHSTAPLLELAERFRAFAHEGCAVARRRSVLYAAAAALLLLGQVAAVFHALPRARERLQKPGAALGARGAVGGDVLVLLTNFTGIGGRLGIAAGRVAGAGAVGGFDEVVGRVAGALAG